MYFLTARASVSRISQRHYLVSRAYSAENDLRLQLRGQLSAAMKAKDKFTSTVLKGLIADVNAAEKSADSSLSSEATRSILRKNVAKRRDAAAQFKSAARTDLADQEIKEAEYIESLLPPLLTQDQVDVTLREILEQLSPSPSVVNSKKLMGIVIKSFYEKVPPSEVDGVLLKSRVDLLLTSISNPTP